jgi:EmrB/QacA subfamily drug resistance transporter
MTPPKARPKKSKRAAGSAHSHSHWAGHKPLSHAEIRRIVFGIMLAMFLGALDQTIVATALPSIGRSLGAVEHLSWVVTAYLLTSTAVTPLYGKLSDMYGRRAMMLIAITIFMLGSLAAALADSMLMLILARGLQGMGAGGLLPLAQTVVGDVVLPKERGRDQAYLSFMWMTAAISGPVLGGFLAQYFHWSLIFWINIPLGLLAMAIINKPLKKLPVAARHHSIDGLGALLLVVATALLLLALNWGGSAYPWTSREILGLLACSAVFSGAFALRLMRAAEPLISLEVLGNPIVLAGTLSMFLLQAANVGLAVYLPVYLQSILGLSASNSGVAMLGLLLGTVAGATFSGRMIPRFVHYKRIALVGTIFAISCLGLLGLVAGHASLVVVEVLTTCIGLGAGTTFPVVTIAVQNAVDRPHLGVATGVLAFLRSLGSALGVAMLGAVALGFGLPLASESAQAAGPVASVTPFVMIFLAAAATLLVSLVTLGLMPEKPLRGQAETEAPILAE